MTPWIRWYVCVSTYAPVTPTGDSNRRSTGTHPDVVLGPVDASEGRTAAAQAALVHVASDGARQAGEAAQAVADCNTSVEGSTQITPPP